MTLVYLASPYSHEDPDVRKWRFLRAVDAAVLLMAQGHLVFSPIAHSHAIAARHGLPCDFGFWAEFDERMIAACDAMVVLCLDGWAHSAGVTAEIALAEQMGKPVKYLDNTSEGWETF